MTYTAINRTIYFLLFLFCVGCTSTERKEVKEDLPSLPSVEFNSKKEISVRISECNFEKVEPRAVAIYESLIEQDGIRLLLGAKMSCDFKNGAFIKEIEKQAKPINDRYKLKGLINRPFKVMIVGYPNVGKSSLINALAKKKKVQVANKPGVTRQQQWIDINSNI